MIKSRFACFTDALILSIISIIFSLIILNNFINSILLKLILSSIFSSIIFIIYYKYEQKKYNKSKIKISEEKHLKNCIFNLKIMNINSKNAFFTNLFAKYSGLQNIQSYGYNIDFFIGNTQEITEQNIINKTSKNYYEIFYIVHKNEYFDNALLSAYNKTLKTKFEYLSPSDLYKIFKETDYFPPEIIQKNKIKLTKKENLTNFISLLFKRKNAKKFFIAGSSLLFLGFFIPFSSHYKYFGIAFLILAIFSVLFGSRKITYKNSN